MLIPPVEILRRLPEDRLLSNCLDISLRLEKSIRLHFTEKIRSRGEIFRPL